MALLQVVSGLTPGQQFQVEGESAVLGRSPECDIVVDVGAVSRKHARIFEKGGEYFIEDRKSRNGTFVNGRVIEGQQKLNENDEITICDVVFTFHYGMAPEQPVGRQLDSSTLAMMVDDEQDVSSTIMTRIDVASRESRADLWSVNAEGKLKALIEISKNLASSVSEHEVLPKILDSLFDVFRQADRGFIVLQETPESPLVVRAVKYRRDDADDTPRISRTIVRQVMESKSAILSADAATDSRFAMSESIADFRIRSMMCAPLISSEGEAIGVLQIDTLDQRSRFGEDDLDLLVSVATQAGFSIENAVLHKQAVWQETVKRDLSLAKQVQQGFLPLDPPQIDGYEFFHFYEPASQVGGDFFDYVELPDNRWAVIVADVSGKGVAAALLMAKVSSEARYCLATEATPAHAIKRLTESFVRHGWSDRFVTFVMAVVDCNSHNVILVNAGHMPPLLRHADGTVEEVGEPIIGVPLGVDPDWEYEQHEFQLNPGDSLTAFTDGFSEAENENRDMYGLEELVNRVSEPATSVTDLGQRILADVKRFVGNTRQSDDMCLLCFGRRA